MAYSKNTWATGDVIDATKLNNLENGVAANDTAISGLAPFVLEGTIGQDGDGKTTFSFTETAEDLFALCEAGGKARIELDAGGVPMVYVGDILAVKTGTGDQTGYAFIIVSFDGTNMMYMVGSGLDGADTVVLTEV